MYGNATGCLLISSIRTFEGNTFYLHENLNGWHISNKTEFETLLMNE